MGAAIVVSTGTGQSDDEEGGDEEEVVPSNPNEVHIAASSSSSGSGSSSGDGSSIGVVTQKASEAVLSEVLTNVDRSLSELLRATSGR